MSDHVQQPGPSGDEERPVFVEYQSVERRPSPLRRRVLIGCAVIAAVVGIPVAIHSCDEHHGLGTEPPGVVQTDPHGTPPPATIPVPTTPPQVQVDVTPHWSAAQPGLPAEITLDLRFTNVGNAPVVAGAFGVNTASGRQVHIDNALQSRPKPRTQAYRFPAPLPVNGTYYDNVTINASLIGRQSFSVVVQGNGDQKNVTPMSQIRCTPARGAGPAVACTLN